MRTFASLLLFLAICLSASAQSNDSVSSATRRFNRWAISIHGSVDRSFRIVQHTADSHLFDKRSKEDQPRTLYTSGIAVSCFLTEKFALQLGINYSKKGYVGTSTTPDGFVPISLTGQRFDYQYIEIPLKTKFLLGKKNLRFFAGAGLMGDFLLKQETGDTYMSDKTSGYRTFNLYVTASTGIDIKLGRIAVQLEPTYGYGLLRTIDAPVTEHLWQAGLDLGLSYTFNSSAKRPSSAEDKKFNRFAISVHGSADYCYRLISANADKFTVREAKDDVPLMGYTAGTGVSYFFTKQFALRLGLNHSLKRYVRNYYYYERPPGDTAPFVVTYFIHNYKYFEIPLEANFFLGKKKIRFLASAGLMATYLRDLRWERGTVSFTPSISKDANNRNLFATGGIGMDINLGHIGIQLMPIYRYGLFETITNEHLWQTGMDLGVSYSF